MGSFGAPPEYAGLRQGPGWGSPEPRFLWVLVSPARAPRAANSCDHATEFSAELSKYLSEPAMLGETLGVRPDIFLPGPRPTYVTKA